MQAAIKYSNVALAMIFLPDLETTCRAPSSHSRAQCLFTTPVPSNSGQEQNGFRFPLPHLNDAYLLLSAHISSHRPWRRHGNFFATRDMIQKTPKRRTSNDMERERRREGHAYLGLKDLLLQLSAKDFKADRFEREVFPG